MITIDQAIQDLQHSDIISNDVQNEICVTPGELITLLKRLKMYEKANTLQPESEWHEDYGDCLFYRVPIQEPPVCTNPLNTDYDENAYTHFTRIPTPNGQSKAEHDLKAIKN